MGKEDSDVTMKTVYTQHCFQKQETTPKRDRGVVSFAQPVKP